MSEADIASTIQSSLSKWTASIPRGASGDWNIAPKEFPNFGVSPAITEPLAQGLRNTLEPFRAVGQSIGALGDVTSSLAKDVMARIDPSMPQVSRPGILGGFENVRALTRNEPQPFDESAGPLQKGAATAVKMIPPLVAAAVGSTVGIPPSVSFPVLTGSETFAKTGDPIASLVSAGSAAVIPKLQEVGMQSAAGIMGSFFKRFAETASGDVETGLVRTLANSRVAQKAVETAVGNGLVQAYVSAPQIPEFVSATPEKQKEMIAQAAIEYIGFSLLQLPYFKGMTPSRTQELIAEDVPFLMNQMYSSPTTIDLLAREGFNPLKAQQFVETPPKQLTTGGGIYATPGIRQQQESDLGQRERVSPIIQTEGPNRNVAPVEPETGTTAGSRDQLVESGQVAQEVKAQAVAPVLAPTLKLAPTLEANLAAYGLTPKSSDAEIEQAITGVIASAQKTLDAGGTLPEPLATELKVIETPVVEPPPGTVETIPPPPPEPAPQPVIVPPPPPPKETPTSAPALEAPPSELVGNKIWLRSDAYHDDFPVAVYRPDGTIERRFASEQDAAQWAKANDLQIQTGIPPGLKAEILSAATVPNVPTSNVPTSNVPTLVDSQRLIDRALSEGGGDAALKALVPNVNIIYGTLEAGRPAQYYRGTITLQKSVLDFIATQWPERAQQEITKIIAEELTHAIADTALSKEIYLGIGQEMSEQDRQEILAERPEIAGNLYQIGAEYFAKRILTPNEQAKPIDPNSSFGQRILAALQKIWDYLAAALKRLTGRNTVIENALRKVRQAKADILAGKTPVFEQGEALNAKAISDMLKSYSEMTAEEEAARQAGKEIGRPTAAQAMGLAKAGEVLAAHPLVRQAVAATQQAAAIQPISPEERHIRNVARGILANPIVSKHLAEPVAMLDAAIEMTDGDLTTFEDVLRDPASTDEMKGAAAGNAKETLMAYDEAVAHFDTKYKTDRDALMEQLQKGAETEFDAAAARDVAGTLFKQFQELGQQIVNQTADQAARSALKQAEDHSATSMKVLNFLSKTGILDGLTHDDNRSIQDLMGYIQRYMLDHRQEFPLGTTPDTIVTDNIGVGLDAIRDVLNIVRLSEPLRTAIAESKNLASGEHYKAPLNAIKNKVLDAISKGNLETAHNIYEKGIVAQGITLKESRDVVNFYAPKSATILTAVRSLDGAKAIIDALQKDPALARQRKEVYDFLNIREITHSVGATSIKFKSTTEGEPDTAITWEGTPADYQANLKAARNLLGDYASYIAMADAGEPGYSPAKAAGLKQSAKELQDYTDPAQDPRRGTLIPGVPGRFTEYLGSFVNHPELVPKYLLPRLAGPLGDMVNKTAQAFSDVKERPANLATNLTGRRRQLLRAALDSHRGMRPWQYRKLVFNPTVASMQNFSDPGQLRVGDPIGNGQHVTKEDLAYIDHIRAFQNEVFATVNNYGKHRFAATARGFAGILFDGNGMVRFPYARGPRMLSRRFPPDLVSTIGPAWRAATTPEAKAKVIDSHLTDILLSYVRGVNASDYGRPYKYRLPFKRIIREFEEQPLTTFDDFVDRVTSLVNQDPDATAVTRDDVRDDLLGEINGFIEAGMKVAEDGAREDQKNPKVHITVVGGNNEMNSPREQAILPPGMYDYGIVSEDEMASFLRDAPISHGNAHLESVIAFLSELTRQIQDYKNQARNRNVPISTIRQESHEAMLKGQQRYSLQVAESLKEVLDAYVTRTENEIRDSANPWMKERPHQVVTNPIMRAVITSIVSPLKPFFRNFVGGGEQVVILNKIMRNLSNPHALASGGKQMIQGALKELVFLGAKATHPGAKRWRAFLEDPRGRAVVGGIAKAFMDVVRERQGLRDLQLELGTTTNANILERLRGQWAFASTGGRVTYDEPGQARRVVNRLATMLNMYSEGLGATFLGYMDSRLNGVGPYITQKVVQDMKATALAYGDKLGPDGLYPDEALSAGWGGWGASNQAAQLRQMWRTNGWGVLDRTLSEYYNKVMAARAQEAQQGFPPGTLEDKVELLTPEQTNQMYVGIPEDINMPTRQSRTGYWKSNPVLKPFGWLLQWGTTWLQKLLGLTQVLNNQPFLKRHGAILPLMISVGILVAIMGTMQTEISSRVIGRMLEGKVTNFPTLFDAVTPGQAASAVLAATADTIPVYGDALNMLTGTGFKRGFDVNSTFLLMNLGSDILKTSKEIFQSGAIGRPLLQFASRYTYPFNQLSARFPSVSGLRDLTNARNILVLGARGTSLETKLRKPGGGIGDQTYTASTPLLNDVVNSIGNGDQEGFQKAFNALVDQKRRSGSLNPQSAALSALRSRNPITSVFGAKPDPADLERVYAKLPGDLASRARDTIGRFNAAIASVAPVKAVRGVRQARAGTARSAGGRFGLRRPSVRLRMPKLRPPQLRRLSA